MSTANQGAPVAHERALVLTLEHEAPDWRHVVIHEALLSAGGGSQTVRQECINYVATQYFKDIPPGAVLDGVRCENLEQQTFGDESFDIVLTYDFSFYGRHADQIIREIWRTLRPGGLLIFAAPQKEAKATTKHRTGGSSKVGGAPGSRSAPTNTEKLPAAVQSGADLPALISSSADFDVTMIRRWDHGHGVLGDMTEVYMCRKRGSHPVFGNAQTSFIPKSGSRPIHEVFAKASEQQWLRALQRSVREPIIGGAEFPRFPHSSVQSGFNGAADEEGMLRAHGFWLYASRWSAALGQPLGVDTPVLDIGCGWGRITRTFAKDVPPHNVFGCDIDHSAIQLCRYLGVPGTFVVNQPNAELPFAPNMFSVITASSVFSHLPERVAQHLVLDMCRAARPGGLLIFTVEDASFFNYFYIPGIESHSERWRFLSRHKATIPALRRRYDAGEYIYLVTNEEAVRSSDVYGDAVIPKTWFTTNFAHELDILDFAPASPPVYQAVVVARKR